MAGDVIEMRPDIGENFFPRRKRLFECRTDRLGQSAENLVEDGAVKRLFVFEVVIE